MAKGTYSVLIVPNPPEDGGGYIGYVPDLPGCMSDGESQEEALANTNDAIDEWIFEAQATGQVVPAPNSAFERTAEMRKKLFEAVKAQHELIDSQESLLDAKDSLLEAKEAVVAAMQAKAEALEEALDSARERTSADIETGWFHVSSIADDNGIKHFHN